MPRYKRTANEAELDVPSEPTMSEASRETLTTLRNMWEFASLMQYIFLFGHVVKIDDDLDIEELEAECLKPTPSEKLASIGLQLLKYVSSHRGLTPEIFDEYTRRQYLAKAPQRNPFGDEEDPINFNDLDIYVRIRVLQQLSTWTLGNAERIRNMMPQDEEHTNWRMEPLGWDKEDRAYYVLDDNRLYRRSDEPLPPPTPKAKPKPSAKSKSRKPAPRKGTRTSKRRKIEDSEDEEQEEQTEGDETAIDETELANGDGEKPNDGEESGYGFTRKTWECIAITHEEYLDFMASIFRSRDSNEKELRQRLEEDVLPIIEKRAEALKQKQMKKIRELENLQKMASAKRSSRLADKADKEAKDREEREAEERRLTELKMAREEQERQKRIEEGHESRRLTREQRVREREAKRILHEEELARLEEEGERAESQGVEDKEEAADAKRASGRQRQNQKEQLKQQLEKLAEEDGNWYFDCSVCGQHGENMDDGSHSIACDRCNVWQHSKCHGFSPKQAEQDGFTFICGTCRRKEEDAKKPKLPPLKLHNRHSGSPESQKNTSRPPTANGQQSNGLPPHLARQLDGPPAAHHAGPSPSPGPFGQITHANGPSFPQSQTPTQGYRYPPVANFAPHPHPSSQYHASPQPPAAYQQSPTVANGYPQHHQQHQYAHQHAVAAAGGHPSHHQQYTGPPQYQQPNGYNQTYPPYAHQQFQRQPQQQWPQYPHQQQHPPPPQHQNQHPPQPSQHLQGQGSSPLANGFPSPSKAAAPRPAPSSSPPQQRPPQPSSTPQPVQQSPKPNLPPPQQRPLPSQSPIKSSPAPAPQPVPAYQLSPAPLYPRPSPTQNPPQLTKTPQQNLQPTTTNGYQRDQLHTPHMQPPTASPNATHVAADGMSGPWPEGSRAIPQKHDQSPAPPTAEKTVLPPVTPLVPSPGQQAAAATGSVPVKKMQSPAQGQAAPGSSVEPPTQQQ